MSGARAPRSWYACKGVGSFRAKGTIIIIGHMEQVDVLPSRHCTS